MKPHVAAALFLAVASVALSQTPTIPNTPAGRTLRAWFDAFNSGDKARIQAYIAKYAPSSQLDDELAFREQTGGFDLLGIDKGDRLRIEFRVKEKASPTTAVGKLEVTDADPAIVSSFGLRAVAPGNSGAHAEPVTLDAAERARVIDGAIANLNEFYVFPETAKKMEDALRTHQAKHDYDTIEDGDTFATKLTDDLQAVSHDKHLRVNFSGEPLPPQPLPTKNAAPDPVADAQRRARLERGNCSFETVERLPSNIGYLKFNGFAPVDICAPTVVAAMNFLANMDALIVDLRGNGGGDPAMVQFICSYLFDQPVHLNDLYNRKEDSTTQFWTLPYVPGKRLAGKPVFVLTSRRTFSGAEEFTYNLKSLKRATIIGETTGGGAHPVSGHRIDDHFIIGVPFARAINPITKTNWEGKGVEPDVKVPADEALDIAKKMAAEQIKKPQGEPAAR